jgi:uncharacterized membrane protein YuzA (DUF378 family)
LKYLHLVSYILLFVGGLNWGYLGLTGDNLLEILLGDALGNAMNYLYVLVGAATVYLAATHMTYCKYCGKGKK